MEYIISDDRMHVSSPLQFDTGLPCVALTKAPYMRPSGEYTGRFLYEFSCQLGTGELIRFNFEHDGPIKFGITPEEAVRRWLIPHLQNKTPSHP